MGAIQHELVGSYSLKPKGRALSYLTEGTIMRDGLRDRRLGGNHVE